MVASLSRLACGHLDLSRNHKWVVDSIRGYKILICWDVFNPSTISRRAPTAQDKVPDLGDFNGTKDIQFINVLDVMWTFIFGNEN